MASSSGNAEGGGKGWLRERLELSKAMRASHEERIPANSVDVVPPLELVGVYAAHIAVSQLVHEGKLGRSAGAFVNAALGVHSFCITHHCTHESISRSMPEHKGLENTVFRLANQIIFLDDSYKEAHVGHHNQTNEETDPDLMLSHSSLPAFGMVLGLLGREGQYAGPGMPVPLSAVEFMSRWNLGWLLDYDIVSNNAGMVRWDEQTGKMFSFEALAALRASGDPELEAAARTLRGTWKESGHVALVLLALFFARYPHRNGVALENELDSFYDNTYKAQGEVELWMAGEAAHHLHHAKPNVSYSYLPRVCEDVETDHPSLRAAPRGTADVRGLEYQHKLPPKDTAPIAQDPWAQTQATLAAADMLAADRAGGVEALALNAIETALRCCTQSDKGLLREVVKGMGLPNRRDPTPEARDSEHPVHKWTETILAEETSREIARETGAIKAAVADFARAAGEKLERPVGTVPEVEAHYLDFFVAMLDTAVTPGQQIRFMAAFQDHVAKKWGRTVKDKSKPFNKQAIVDRLGEFLASKVPDDFSRNKTYLTGKKSTPRKNIDRIFLGSNL